VCLLSHVLLGMLVSKGEPLNKTSIVI